MTVGLVTRGMVCFGTGGGATVFVESVESEIEMIEGNVPDITSITDMKPTIVSGAADADVRPTITGIKIVKPKIQ
jgi:hypothetical protein